jgi:hypothetical protein
MTVRRRSRRRRPLTEFAQRSPLHAVLAALIRFALLALLAVVAFLVIMNVLVPNMIDGLVDELGNRSR